MKIQVNINSPKSIEIYKQIETKVKGKALERALLLLAKDEEYRDMFFEHRKVKKTQQQTKKISKPEVSTNDTKDENSGGEVIAPLIAEHTDIITPTVEVVEESDNTNVEEITDGSQVIEHEDEDDIEKVTGENQVIEITDW